MTPFTNHRGLVAWTVALAIVSQGCAYTRELNLTASRHWSPMMQGPPPPADSAVQDRERFLEHLVQYRVQEAGAERTYRANARSLRIAALVVAVVETVALVEWIRFERRYECTAASGQFLYQCYAWTPPAVSVSLLLQRARVEGAKANGRARCTRYLDEMADLFNRKWTDASLPANETAWTEYRGDQVNILLRGAC